MSDFSADAPEGSLAKPLRDPAPLPAIDAPVIRPSRFRERTTALIEVILTSGFPTQLLVSYVLAHLGMPLRTPDGGMVPVFVFTVSLVDAVLVTALVAYFLRDGGERVRDVLIGHRPVVPEALIGMALVPVAFMLLVVVMSILLALAPAMHNVAVNPLGAMMQTPRDTLIFAVVVMVAGGIREEVQRAFIIHRFDQSLGGGAVGVAVYSLAFGLGHVQQGYDAMVATAALGALWGAVYLVRRSIVAPVVSHGAFDLLQLLKFAMLR